MTQRLALKRLRSSANRISLRVQPRFIATWFTSGGEGRLKPGTKTQWFDH
jgi:hypothetical protein